MWKICCCTHTPTQQLTMSYKYFRFVVPFYTLHSVILFHQSDGDKFIDRLYNTRHGAWHFFSINIRFIHGVTATWNTMNGALPLFAYFGLASKPEKHTYGTYCTHFSIDKKNHTEISILQRFSTKSALQAVYLCYVDWMPPFILIALFYSRDFIGFSIFFHSIFQIENWADFFLTQQTLWDWRDFSIGDCLFSELVAVLQNRS